MKFFFLIICLFWGKVCFSQKSFSYKPSNELASIESYFYYYVDSTKNLQFAQINQLPDSVFKLNTKDYFNFGNTEYPIWIRANLENKSNDELYLIQELHDVRLLDVHLINTDDSILSWFTGSMRPFGTHFLKRNSTVFDLGKTPKRIFLRIHNPNIYIPLKIGNIEALSNYLHHYDLFYGCIYGVLIALILYNLFVYSIVRDKLFLYYFFYILSSAYIIFRADNHHQEFIFNQIPDFSFDINLSSTIAIFFTLVFANAYLQIRELAPKFFWILVGLWSIGFILLPSEWLPYQPWVNDIYQLLYILLMFVLLAASIYIHFLGYKPAKFFILAFSFYILGVVSILLGLMGVLSMNQIRSAYIYQICSVIEALFFAFAVAYRFNTYRKEAQDAKQLALQLSQKQEELLIRNNQLLTDKLKIEQNLKTFKGEKDINQLILQMQSGSQFIKKISIPTIEGIIMFPVRDITRLEAMGSYCTIHLTDNKKITTSKPMAHFEQMIEDAQFMRIHKSHIVNLHNISRYIRGEGGWVEMKDKSEIPVSRRAKTELLKRLEIE